MAKKPATPKKLDIDSNPEADRRKDIRGAISKAIMSSKKLKSVKVKFK